MAQNKKPRKKYSPNQYPTYSFTTQVILKEFKEIKEALKEEYIFAPKYYLLVLAFKHLIISFDFLKNKNVKLVKYINSLLDSIDKVFIRIIKKCEFVEEKLKTVPTATRLPPVAKLKIYWFITELEKMFSAIDVGLFFGFELKDYIAKMKSAELNFKLQEKLRCSACLIFAKLMEEVVYDKKN